MTRFWKAVLLTTLVAGTLDIIAAHVHQTFLRGEFPSKMFYVIAGGAIGLEKALSGGPVIFILGIFIHYFISFSFTLFFFLLLPVLSRNSQNKYVNGVLYAVFVWVTMNFIVLPMTALPDSPFVFNIHQVVGFFILVAVFGLPISLMADRYHRSRIDTSDFRTAKNGDLPV
jgi:hypothetical protein